MFRRFLILMITVVFIVGCVQTPEGVAPSQVNASAKKVGYWINVRSNPTHTHVGTTVLTNFTKTYPFAWGIRSYMEKEIAKKLETSAGVEAINLRKKGIGSSEVNGLVKKVRGTWMISSGKKEVYQNLVNRLGLSAIVVINESEKKAVNDCGVLGCKTVTAKGYGLLTHSFVNSNKFFSATAFYTHLYTLKPVASLDTYLKKINESENMTLVAVSRGSKVDENKIDFIYPKNFNKWTEQEFKPFRAPLMKYIDNMTQLISEVLRDKL